MLLKLAWRNLWRQKRRTLLTASTLALALFLSLLMRSFQEGQYANNIQNMAKLNTGLIQLQNPEFKESRSIDDLLPSSSEFIQVTRNNTNVDFILPRIESFILSASGDRSKGVLLVGIDPTIEDQYTGLASKIVDGEYLTNQENGVLLAEGVANYFNLTVGDEIIFYGQGYRGQTAAGVYPITGILHLPMKDLNNQMVYMSISSAQTLFSTEQQVTSWVLSLYDLNELDTTVDELVMAYGSDVLVRDWTDLAPEMEQSIMLDRVSGLIMMYLLYIVVGFGLFATLIMMTLERQREFSVMLATGMSRTVLLRLLALESLFIGFLGAILGFLFALPLLVYYFYNPIQLTGDIAKTMLDMGYEPVMPVSLAPSIFIDQLLIILALLALCLIYPMWRVLKLQVIAGLKGAGHVA